jgi:hypothetical protein
MPVNKEQTTFSVSTDLKTAMISKSILPVKDVNQTFYKASNEVHLFIADMSDGTYRCITKTTSGLEFDFCDISDNALVRMFTYAELAREVSRYTGVSRADYTEQGANKTFTITHNGINRVGVSTNLADACALAFIEVLNN